MLRFGTVTWQVIENVKVGKLKNTYFNILKF